MRAHVAHARKVLPISRTKLFSAEDRGSTGRRENKKNGNQHVYTVVIALISTINCSIAALVGVFIGIKQEFLPFGLAHGHNPFLYFSGRHVPRA